MVAHLYLGQAYYSFGDYPRAIDVLRWNVESLQGELLYERFGLPGLLSVYSRSWLVACLAELGVFTEGIAKGEEEIRIAEAAGQLFSLGHASFGAGGLYLRKGDFEKAISVLERGLGVCHVSQIPLMFPFVASALGYAYALSGRVADAMPLLEQSVEHLRLMFGHSVWVAWLGEAYLLAGRLNDATQAAQRGLDLSLDRKERGHEAWALRLLGEIASHRDPPDIEQAEVHYRDARALAEKLGMRPLVAHCHLGLGKLYQQTGARQQAPEHLTTAATMYREMDMRFWLEQAEAALGVLSSGQEYEG